jgi:predicted nucleic acid-binding protein
MLVVDSSAVLDALVSRDPSPDLIDRLATDGDLHAPHLIDIELLHVLRRLVMSARLTEYRAADARSDFADLALVRYPHQELGERIWSCAKTSRRMTRRSWRWPRRWTRRS